MSHNHHQIKKMVKQKGMTLIEVLVASTILFSFLAVMTQVMGTASIASEQAEKNITISLNMPFMVDEIKNKIIAGTFASNGHFTMADVSYDWQAQQHQRKAIWQSILDEQSAQRYVTMYNVHLNVNFKSLQKSFYYTEVISEK